MLGNLANGHATEKPQFNDSCCAFISFRQTLQSLVQRERVDRAPAGWRFHLFEVDTFGYDVGVFALGALGVTFLAFSNLLVGGVLTLSAPILAFVLKDRVDSTIREKATEQGLTAIERAPAFEAGRPVLQVAPMRL